MLSKTEYADLDLAIAAMQLFVDTEGLELITPYPVQFTDNAGVLKWFIITERTM